MRLSLCRALILLRNKSLIEPSQLHKLFFQLLRCQDKSLRSFLKDNIVNDIKNINSKGKDQKLNSELQNFMYSMLKDSATIAAKTSLDVTLANKFNKKTRKREKYLENIKKAHKKKKKKNSAPSYNFSALHLIHDPQEFAEKLFRRLEGLNEKFEVKLMLLELVSRLIGTHQLILLNYYPYIARFLAPRQREVIRLLQFSAQAAHEMVPPDCLEPVLKAIINNFVTERNSSEVMAVGLNAVRELCARCPL